MSDTESTHSILPESCLSTANPSASRQKPATYNELRACLKAAADGDEHRESLNRSKSCLIKEAIAKNLVDEYGCIKNVDQSRDPVTNHASYDNKEAIAIAKNNVHEGVTLTNPSYSKHDRLIFMMCVMNAAVLLCVLGQSFPEARTFVQTACADSLEWSVSMLSIITAYIRSQIDILRELDNLLDV